MADNTDAPDGRPSVLPEFYASVQREREQGEHDENAAGHQRNLEQFVQNHPSRHDEFVAEHQAAVQDFQVVADQTVAQRRIEELARKFTEQNERGHKQNTRQKDRSRDYER